MLATYAALATRLEAVRILYGDWEKALTKSVATRFGTTAVFLDPPYTAAAKRKKNLYAVDDETVGHRVREWAVASGADPMFRIALCGYDGEYQMPSDWTVLRWRSAGGGAKRGRERIWFSPHCLV